MSSTLTDQEIQVSLLVTEFGIKANSPSKDFQAVTEIKKLVKKIDRIYTGGYQR